MASSKELNLQLQEIATWLWQKDDIVILTHKHPDGDTLGAAFGLYYAFIENGKSACVINADSFPEKFSYFYPSSMKVSDGQIIVAVDIADAQLLGGSLEAYREKVDLCIDHHRINRLSSKRKFVDEHASSTCEIVFELLQYWGITVSQRAADALYTGICTDTGCFRYSNTTAASLRVAAKLMDCGARAEEINRTMFEIKSFARLSLERIVLDEMKFYYENRCCLVTVTNAMMLQAKADESTFDGIPAMTRMVEGVQIGVTIREKDSMHYKISFRTSQEVDASALAACFNGGGHVRAAGCTMEGTLEEVHDRLLDEIGRWVK